jgi:hypothetical protein
MVESSGDVDFFLGAEASYFKGEAFYVEGCGEVDFFLWGEASYFKEAFFDSIASTGYYSEGLLGMIGSWAG